MKSGLRHSGLSVLVAAVVLAAGLAAAQEMSQEEMMQKYMQAATPGEHHELLASSAGTWKATTKAWMDPAGEPMVSHGTEKAEMILGGRYLESSFEGMSMGMPMHGRGLMGYDNVKQKYVGTWCDTMGTGIMTYEGEMHGDDMICHGEFIDAATGMTLKAKLVTKFVDDDHRVFEFWGTGPTGDMVKWMEISYEREK